MSLKTDPITDQAPERDPRSPSMMGQASEAQAKSADELKAIARVLVAFLLAGGVLEAHNLIAKGAFEECIRLSLMVAGVALVFCIAYWIAARILD